jgi:hypothetical protein
MGRHPAVWKRESRVVMCISANDNYTNLQADYSISVPSCLWNVVDNVVAELAAAEAERRGRLIDGQGPSRKTRSAVNKAAIMVDQVHAANRVDSVTSVPMMVIKAAFARVGRGILVHSIKHKATDGDRKQWIACILSPRTIQLVIKG